MFRQATIDYITHSKDLSEFALYLIEKGPWTEPVREKLLPIQERIYTVVDVVLDGQLASDYPDSRGKKVRIDVVFKGDPPPDDEFQMITRLDEFICSSPEHALVAIESGLLSSLRIVCHVE